MSILVAMLVFLGGIAVGRMGVIPQLAPPATLSSEAMDVPEGLSVAYLASVRSPGHADLALVRRTLDTGEVQVPQRLNVPSGYLLTTSRSQSELVAMGGSVAVIVRSASRGVLAASPQGGTPLSWIPAEQAAWQDPQTLMVLNGSTVTKWSFNPLSQSIVEGQWTALHSTLGGVVLEGVDATGRYLTSESDTAPAVRLPDYGRVLAVAPSAKKAFLDVDSKGVVWDGTTSITVQLDEFTPIAASFSNDGQRVAATVRPTQATRSAQMMLAVFDEVGSQVALDRAGAWEGPDACAAPPLWQPIGRWVFVSGAGGVLYGYEVGAGSKPSLKIHNDGCGLSWAS